MAELVGLVDAQFGRLPETEMSIEVDPRRVEAGRMAFLAALGFNRVSIGV